MILVKDAGRQLADEWRMIAIDPPLALSLRAKSQVDCASASSIADYPTTSVPPLARHWTGLAVSSLVLAGLLSLAVVVGRLPFMSGLINDPLFFKRCLVVHVDLALIVWFYAFIAALADLRVPGLCTIGQRASWWSAATGMALMLAGAAVPGSLPVLANYIPVIDHPLFLTGLGLFFASVLAFFFQKVIARPRQAAGRLPEDASVGILTAALAVFLAATSWISARAGLPDGLDPWTRAEFSSWGAGHVLQVANVSAMIAVWLWLLARATGCPVFTRRQARCLFGLLLAPHFVMPLLTWRGSLNQLYLDGATFLMRWGIFPILLVSLLACINHLRRHCPDPADQPARFARAAFKVSLSLSLLGMALGAAIRGSTTLIPAHYHASLGAVTAAFMAAAFLIVEAAARDSGRLDALTRLWRPARHQILLFGIGQGIFALGFGLGGIFGLGRKAYASEQIVRSAGEWAGLAIMGAGGLVAVAAGIWFLVLIIREMRRWAPITMPQSPIPAISTHASP
ncbi:MAG: hypothetical protein ACKV19_06195 [Verrucomicrobiales bacterium]